FCMIEEDEVHRSSGLWLQDRFYLFKGMGLGLSCFQLAHLRHDPSMYQHQLFFLNNPLICHYGLTNDLRPVSCVAFLDDALYSNLVRSPKINVHRSSSYAY